MTKMTEAQLRFILTAHHRVDHDQHDGGSDLRGLIIGARGATLDVLLRNGWASMRNDMVFASVTPAGLRAAGVDLDQLHAEALELNAQRTAGLGTLEWAEKLKIPEWAENPLGIELNEPEDRSYRPVLDLDDVFAHCTHGADCRVHPDAQQVHNFNPPPTAAEPAYVPATTYGLELWQHACGSTALETGPVQPHPDQCDSCRRFRPLTSDPWHRLYVRVPSTPAEARTGVSGRVAAALQELADLRTVVMAHDAGLKLRTLRTIDRAVELLRAEAGR